MKEFEGQFLEFRAGLERLGSIPSEFIYRSSGADLHDASCLALDLERRRARFRRCRHQARTALERLRIGMLGLAAGVATPSGLEDILIQARALRSRIDRLTEALRAAEALLGEHQTRVTIPPLLRHLFGDESRMGSAAPPTTIARPPLHEEEIHEEMDRIRNRFVASRPGFVRWG